MSDETRYEYKISEGDIQEINPAIDYRDGIGYIGMYLHCTKKNIDKNTEESSIEHFIIKSDRQIIHSGQALPDGD